MRVAHNYELLSAVDIQACFGMRFEDDVELFATFNVEYLVALEIL